MIGPRLKDLSRWYSGGTPPSEGLEHWDGDVPWLSGKDFDRTRLREPTKFITRAAAERYSRWMPGGRTVVVLVRGMALVHGLPVARLEFDAAVNQDVRALRVDDRFDPGFVYYSMLGHRANLDIHTDRAAHGTLRVRESLYAHRLSAIPPLSDQLATATSLDDECQRIAQVTRAQGGVAAAVAAFTMRARGAEFGADGRASIDSGAGDRLRFLVREIDHRVGQQSLPLLSVTLDRGVIRRDQLTNERPRSADVAAYKVVHAQDIVVNRMRAFQGAVGVAPENGIVSPDYLVLRTTARAIPQLVAHGLASHAGASAMAARVRGIGGVENGAVRTPRINAADLLDLRMVVPEVPVQYDIVGRIEAAIEGFAIMRRRADDAAAVLTAYRDSLIHEAVTGKLDVTRVSDAQMDERLHAAAEGRLDEVRG